MTLRSLIKEYLDENRLKPPVYREEIKELVLIEPFRTNTVRGIQVTDIDILNVSISEDHSRDEFRASFLINYRVKDKVDIAYIRISDYIAITHEYINFEEFKGHMDEITEYFGKLMAEGLGSRLLYGTVIPQNNYFTNMFKFAVKKYNKKLPDDLKLYFKLDI